MTLTIILIINSNPISNMRKLQAKKVKSLGETPTARFGHTFTMVSKTKGVLFGGAISDNSKFVITNETYLYDFQTHRWKKLQFEGQVPSERAAHAAASIGELQMAVYGGAASGTQGLLKDDLYVLDLRRDPTWKTVEIASKQNTPGQRYGHSMVYSKPFLIIFGGNTGNKVQNDVWLFNTSKTQSSWVKYDFGNQPMPCPRVYHSAALCEVGAAQGMIVVFGGRRRENSGQQSVVPALNDIWGLRKHRDGSWDWVFPPKTFNPLPRYQHMICFAGPVMLIIGGRTNMPQQAASLIEAYNTETSQWYQMQACYQMQAVSRYRHAIVTVNNTLYIHGGFDPEFATHPLQTMMSVQMPTFSALTGSENSSQPQMPMTPMTPSLQQQVPPEMTSSERSDRMMQSKGIPTGDNQRRELREIKDVRNLSSNSRVKAFQKNKERELTPSRILTSAKNIRLSNQAIIATGENSNNMQIQKVHVNTLLEESKRLTQTPKLEEQTIAQPQLIDCFLSILLPTNSIPKSLNSALFPFKKQKINRLCQDVCLLLSDLPSSVVYVRAPVKIYGCLYGRYQQLLRLFQNFGNPDDHQTQTFDFIFLGNYVDKGYNSLQTICLLLALKLKYPQHIILLRGSHEDAKVNRLFGLAEECAVRLGENITDPNSVYNNLNRVFDLLPLAAVVEDKILCVHSGVGAMKSLAELEAIERPTTVQKHKAVVDVLWSSTYADTRDVMGYNPSKSSESAINTFLETNNLMMVVRSRECVPEGYESDGNKINIFSVSNYGKAGGSAAILKITKNLDVVPFVLQANNNMRSPWINQTPLKTGIMYTEQEQQLRKKMFSPMRKR